MEILRVELDESGAGLLEALSVEGLLAAELSVDFLSLDEVLGAPNFLLLSLGPPGNRCSVRHLAIVEANLGET
jgi:hypothetical protein